MIERLSLSVLLILLASEFAASQPRGRVTARTRQNLVNQMLRDGQINDACVREVGGVAKFSINPVDLNRDRRPEFDVSGQGGCLCGARRCKEWLYRLTGSGYELILGPLESDGFVPQKSRTNGFSDLVTAESGISGFFSTKWKFDGSRYQMAECEEWHVNSFSYTVSRTSRGARFRIKSHRDLSVNLVYRPAARPLS